MDEIMNKVGTYWLGQRANKEISSAGDDIEVRAITPVLSSHHSKFRSFLLRHISG
jgi:hypothetical protein